MKKLEQRVPNLRFKGFTDDWEQRKLGDVVNFFSGLTYHPSDVKNKGYFVIRSSNIQNNQIVSADDIFVNKDIINVPNVKQGDSIVVVRNGSRKLIGKHAQVLTDMPNTVIGAFMTGVRSKSNFYINALLDSDQFQKEIYKNLGATINQITIGEFRKMRFIITSGNEAQTIGEFFKKIDTLITLQQRKLDLLKQLKKGFLQKMFADKDSKQPVLRFKGFHDDWERRKLGEAAEIIGGGTPSTQISNYWNGDINWYTPAEISNFIYTRKSKRKISMEGLENSSARLLPVGTVLFTSRAGIGKTAILSKEGTTNQGFQSIVPNKKLLDSYFIFSLTNELKKYGETHGAGSTFIEISGRELAKAPLKLPALKEQKKIGGLLHQVDELISLQQQKLAKYQSIKKSLLQQMFI